MLSRSTEPRWGRRLAAVLIAATFVAAACGDDDNSGTATTAGGATTTAASGGATTTTPSGTTATTAAGAETTATAAAGGGKEIVVGAVLAPTSLDIVKVAGAALDQVLLDNVYETILKLDKDGDVGPGLAALPEITDDGTTYTFKLQPGVRFHSGEPLTSADVKWSLDAQRAKDANEAIRLAGISAVDAPDPQTVVVHLTERDNDFSYRLTRRAGAVLQANATGLENTANGTGPFKLQKFKVNTFVSLVRNDDYWGTKPSIGGVTFQYYKEPNAAVNAFTTGDINILTGVSSDLIGPLKDNPDYVVNEGTTNGEVTLGFNNKRKPFTDRDVRFAFRQAIDKEAFKELLNGYGTIIGGPVPPTDPWYEDLTKIAPYDPAAAKAALQKAGYGSGLKLTLTWPNIYPTNQAEFVASQLKDVGVDVTIQTVEFSVWLDQVFTKHDYDMTVVNHVEPHDIGNYANPDYYWQYDSPTVQKLIHDAQVNPDPQAGIDQLKQAARQISEDSPVDWLILASDLTVSTKDVTGYPKNDTASRFDASGITISG
jgi:peptide/nickel transport system substrate-binding protein